MYCALHTIRRRVFCCSSGTILNFLNTAWVCAAPTVSHSSLKVLPEQLVRRPQILRQTLQGRCPQFLWHPVKGFGNAAGDAGKGVAVAAKGDRIAERIYQYSEVTSVYLMSGAFDFTVIIEGKTMREVAQFVSEKLSPMDSVLSTATHFVLKKYKDHGTVMCGKAEDERMMITP